MVSGISGFSGTSGSSGSSGSIGISGISGVGIDLVRIERIARWMERPGMVERFFHPEEIDAATSRGAGAAASLAARFAAKEAFGKALGTGLAGLELRDIWVHNDDYGQPFITLQGSSAELFMARGGGIVHCSLSHEKDYAIALVVIETKHQNKTRNG